MPKKGEGFENSSYNFPKLKKETHTLLFSSLKLFLSFPHKTACADFSSVSYRPNLLSSVENRDWRYDRYFFRNKTFLFAKPER